MTPKERYRAKPETKEKERAYAREWNRRNKGRYDATQLVWRYGITLGEKQEMLDRQGGLCAICKERPAEHVDHDHETKVVRGLLCAPCNRALGIFGDTLDGLKRAVTYLEKTCRPSSRS